MYAVLIEGLAEVFWGIFAFRLLFLEVCSEWYASSKLITVNYMVRATCTTAMQDTSK